MKNYWLYKACGLWLKAFTYLLMFLLMFAVGMLFLVWIAGSVAEGYMIGIGTIAVITTLVMFYYDDF